MEATVTCNLFARVCGCVVSVRTLALSCFLPCVFLPSHAHAHARRIHFITPSSSPCVVSSLFHTHTTWLTLRVTGHTPCALPRRKLRRHNVSRIVQAITYTPGGRVHLYSTWGSLHCLQAGQPASQSARCLCVLSSCGKDQEIPVKTYPVTAVTSQALGDPEAKLGFVCVCDLPSPRPPLPAQCRHC